MTPTIRCFTLLEFRAGLYQYKEAPFVFDYKDQHLKYFNPSYLQQAKDDDVYLFLATVPKQSKRSTKPVDQILGALELRRFNPENTSEWSMPYVTVSPKVQGKGIAKKLTQEAAEWLKHNQGTLIRTENSDSGLKVQKAIDCLLYEHAVPWTQKRRMHALERDWDTKATVTTFEHQNQLIYALLKRDRALLQAAMLAGASWKKPASNLYHPVATALEQHFPANAIDLFASLNAEEQMHVVYCIVERAWENALDLVAEHLGITKEYLYTMSCYSIGHTGLLDSKLQPQHWSLNQENINQAVLGIEKYGRGDYRLGWSIDTWKTAIQSYQAFHKQNPMLG